MKHFTHLTLFIFFIFLSTRVFSQDFKSSSQIFYVNTVSFSGQKFFSEKELAKEIQTRQNGYLISKSIKPGLWSYYYFDIFPDGKVTDYLKTNLGEAPSRFNYLAFIDDVSYLKQYYQYFGFLNVEIDTTIRRSEKQWLDIGFIINENDRGIIKKIEYEISPIVGGKAKIRINDESLLSSNQGYSVFNIRNERDRILNILLDEGHYFTTADSISVIADTTSFPSIDLTFFINSSYPAIVSTQNIQLYTYRREVDSVLSETIVSDDFIIYTSDKNEISDKIIKRQIELRKGDKYTPALRSATSRNLNELNIFSTVSTSIDSVRFDEADGQYRIFPKYILGMAPKHEIRPEIRLDTKAEGSVGMDVTYTNRNFLNSAENFRFRIGGSFQLAYLFSGKDESEWSLESGVDLTLPYFFETRNKLLFTINTQRALKSATISKIDTVIDATTGTKSIRRSDPIYEPYYLSILTTGFRLQWQHATYTRSYIDFLEMSYVNAGQVYFESQNFQFIQRPYLNSVFRWTIQWINTNLIDRNYGGTQEISIEESGSVPYLITRQFSGANTKADSSNTGSIFNLDYYQYVKMHSDLRWYLPINKQEVVALKFYSGLIFPYGESITTPIPNRFFGGGINSLRAWLPTELGPGSAGKGGGYYDVKIEGSVEFRKKWNDMWGYVAFVDYGNLWTRGNEPGAFAIKDFWQEIAIDVGLGIRNYILPIGPIRLDFAWKVYDPVLPLSERWIIRKYRISKPLEFISDATFFIGIGHTF